MSTQPIQGIHHITVFASDPQKNIDFYTQVLGQRFVKKTVNFDDPGTYHLYYGDNVGSPGTIMTFFPWPMAKRGTRGNGEVAATGYGILASSVSYWKARLTEFNLSYQTEQRFGKEAIIFQDPDGMFVELIVTDGDPVPAHWTNGPIPEEHALRGFHGVTLWVHEAQGTSALLHGLFGFEKVGEESNRIRFQGTGKFGQYIDLVVRPNAPRGQMGAGTVHHVALRTVDDSEQIAWQKVLRNYGFGVTDVKDRQYFHSIYFREPNGILFEVATDAPGFLWDEPVETLGRDLKLPPWLEIHREKIEDHVVPVTIAEYTAA